MQPKKDVNITMAMESDCLIDVGSTSILNNISKVKDSKFQVLWLTYMLFSDRSTTGHVISHLIKRNNDTK